MYLAFAGMRAAAAGGNPCRNGPPVDYSRNEMSPEAQTMIENLERSPMKATMLARLAQMVASGNDADGTAKEVTEHFAKAGSSRAVKTEDLSPEMIEAIENSRMRDN